MSAQSQYPQDRQPWENLLPLAAAIIVALLLLTGCNPKAWEYLHHGQQVQHDSVIVVVRDSVRFYDRDSIFIKEKGDTVYKYVEKWRWRDRVKVDTFYKVRIDSVAVESIRTVEVEKPLSAVRKAEIGAFPWLVGALAVCIVLLVRRKNNQIFKI
ncbi:MAG: hypothetical protein K6E61_03395 [Bacteroidales bacterium]|nr:hypothetical protein [Bacteroidales bacterium]